MPPLLERLTKWSFLTVGLLILLFAAVCALVLFKDLGPGGDGVLAAQRLPDGSEYMVTQKWKGWAEPYTVNFYLRSPGGLWGCCYIDHQATRRREIGLNYDAKTDVVEVTDGGHRRAALDRRRKTFWLDLGRTQREVPAPQTVNVTPDFPFVAR